MRENDYKELDMAVEEFEDVISALRQIADISDKAKETSDQLENLRKAMELSAHQLEKKAINLIDNIDGYNRLLERSTGQLTAAKEEFVSSEQKLAEHLGNMINERTAEAINCCRSQMEMTKKTIAESSREFSDKIKIEAEVMREKLDSSSEDLSKQLDRKTLNINSKLNSIDQRTSDRLDALEKVLSSKISILESATEKNRNLLVTGLIFSITALILSVIGFII